MTFDILLYVIAGVTFGATVVLVCWVYVLDRRSR